MKIVAIIILLKGYYANQEKVLHKFYIQIPLKKMRDFVKN